MEVEFEFEFEFATEPSATETLPDLEDAWSVGGRSSTTSPSSLSSLSPPKPHEETGETHRVCDQESSSSSLFDGAIPKSGDEELDLYLADCAETQYGYRALRVFFMLCRQTNDDLKFTDLLVFAVHSLWNVYLHARDTTTDHDRRNRMIGLMGATLDCLRGIGALDAAVTSTLQKRVMTAMVRRLRKFPTGPPETLDMAKILWVYRTEHTIGPLRNMIRQIERLEEAHRTDFKEEATTGGPNWSIEFENEFEGYQRKRASSVLFT